jgi:HSF-type DNA-binding
MQDNKNNDTSGSETPKGSNFPQTRLDDEIDSSTTDSIASPETRSNNFHNQERRHDPNTLSFSNRLRLLQTSSEQDIQKDEQQNANVRRSDSMMDEAFAVHHALLQQKLQDGAKYGRNLATGFSDEMLVSKKPLFNDLQNAQKEINQYHQHDQRWPLQFATGTELKSEKYNQSDTLSVASHLASLLQKQNDEQRLLYLLQQHHAQNRIQSFAPALPAMTQQHSSAMEEILLGRLGVGNFPPNIAQSAAASFSVGDRLSELRYLQLQSQLGQLHREQLLFNQTQLDQKPPSQSTSTISLLMNKSGKELPQQIVDKDRKKIDLPSSSLQDTNEDWILSNKTTSLPSSTDGIGVGSGIGYLILRSRNPFFTSYQDHVRAGTQLRKEYQQIHSNDKLQNNQQQFSKTNITRMHKKKRVFQVNHDEVELNDSESDSTRDNEKELVHKHKDEMGRNNTKSETSEIPISKSEQEIDEDAAKTADTFPFKLYMMIKDAKDQDAEDIISFLPHGCAFAVHKPAQFVSDILPKYFKSGRMSSFQRQLNLYGFRRISDGPDQGGYWHDFFLQDCPLLCKDIARKKTSSSLMTATMSSPLPANDDAGAYSGVASLHSLQATRNLGKIANSPPTERSRTATTEANPEPALAQSQHPLSTSMLLGQTNRFDPDPLTSAIDKANTSSLLDLVRQQQQNDLERGIGQQQRQDLLDLIPNEAVFPMARQNIQEQLMMSNIKFSRNIDSLNDLTTTSSTQPSLTASETLLLSSLQRQQQIAGIGLSNVSNNHPSFLHNTPRSNDTAILELLLLQQLQQQKDRDESNQSGNG